MRLVTFSNHGSSAWGALDGAAIRLMCEADPSLPATVKQLLSGGAPALEQAAAALADAPRVPLDSVRLLAPIPDPQKVICVGLNYADHAAETKAVVADEPVIFSKFPTTICAAGDVIRLPQVGAQVDYEAELVVVIGTAGKNIARENAMRHVAGYCCGHDVSARDWQKGKPGGQWTLGKGFDTFAPLGPALVTADEIADPHNLHIQLRLNGQTMQDSNTPQLICKIDYLVSYLSRVCTLLPGDLIYTGTPSGVGMARTPKVFLKHGDGVEVEIEPVGLLKNTVVDEG
ncbi:MAG: fumarylacetoacetate hydrolase family protein [Planctomycetales bacterium]|nr:fumarylacetoacetate hydrolase family protein [Planctomycetales bacterium]